MVIKGRNLFIMSKFVRIADSDGSGQTALFDLTLYEFL